MHRWCPSAWPVIEVYGGPASGGEGQGEDQKRSVGWREGPWEIGWQGGGAAGGWWATGGRGHVRLAIQSPSHWLAIELQRFP